MIKSNEVFRSIRGGGVFGGVFVVILAVCGALIIPFFIQQWAVKDSFPSVGIFLGLTFGIPFFTAAVIELNSIFAYRLVITNNGDLTITPFGTRKKLQKCSMNIHEATSVSLQGSGISFYKDDKVIFQINTKPISRKKAGQFLGAVCQINPKIHCEELSRELLTKGTTKKTDKKNSQTFKALVLMLWGPILLIFWVPAIELVINRLLIGKFNETQVALSVLFFQTFLPFGVLVYFVILIWQVDLKAFRKVLQYTLYFVLFIIAAQVLNKVYLLNPTIIYFSFTGGLVLLLVTLIIASYLIGDVKGIRILKGVITAIIIGSSLFYHVVGYVDFFSKAVEEQDTFVLLKSRQVLGSKSELPGGIGIRFVCSRGPQKTWDISVAVDKLPMVERLFQKPVNLYYTPNLETFIKVEDPISHQVFYSINR